MLVVGHSVDGTATMVSSATMGVVCGEPQEASRVATIAIVTVFFTPI